MMNSADRRSLPAVDQVLQRLESIDLPQLMVTSIIRGELASLRRTAEIPPLPAIMDRVHKALDQVRQSRLQPVINATGVLLHTNLGRAPLSAQAVQELQEIAKGYSNLEYDLTAGKRGRRTPYVEQSLALLCGSEAATVVNNCAAALVMIIRTLSARKPEVVISRGEMIQIGGGFRIPQLLESSGARLREVGTTNQTTLEDYAQAIGPETGLLLKVHRSNFFMGGFVASPGVRELASLARKRRVPLVHDLGSGAMVRTERIAPVDHEPTPAEILRQGVDLICCSGDKLMGGPQAGVIAGKRRYVAAVKRDPLFRALRCDKLILAALQTTVDQYLKETAFTEIPLLDQLAQSAEKLQTRLQDLLERVRKSPGKLRIGTGKSRLGGGTMPDSFIPSATLDIQPSDLSLGELTLRLRLQKPPVIGYVTSGWLKLDLRTVLPDQDKLLAAAVQNALLPSR